MALFSADDITYPPLDVPKPVADGVLTAVLCASSACWGYRSG
jgi:hypothetical protein